jgi:signal transduction histidine kinase
MRRRITALAVLTAAVSTVLFGVPLALVARNDALVHERTEATELAQGAALAVAPVLATGSAVTDVPQAAESDLRVAVYDQSGRRLAGRGPGDPGATTRSAAERSTVAHDDDEGGDIVVAVPIEVGGSVVAVARSATPRSEVTVQAAAAAGLLLLIGGAAVLVGGFVARGLGGRLAGPLEDLTGSARRLGHGDFSVRSSRSGILEVDAVGQALDATATRLGALVTQERAFAAGASHQLRTPLTGVRLHLERALTGPPAERADALAAAVRAADRLEGTIEDLLSITREIRTEGPLDVPGLIADLVDTWSPVLAAHGRRLTVRQEPDLPASQASWAAVRQVLTVLLDNASTHGRGEVTLTARDAGGLLALDVADQGVALDGTDDPVAGAELEHPGAPGARRLGLPLARALAEAEGGRLRLADTCPTTMSLLLPGRPPTADTPD